MSVRPYVCPVDRQQQQRPAGLLLRSGAGSRYRSVAAAAAAAAAAAVRAALIFWSDCNDSDNILVKFRVIIFYYMY